MSLNRVLVAGGTGFIGSHVVARLSAQGVRVVVPTRHRERARHLLPLPTVDVIETRPGSPSFWQALEGCDAVINLVGVLHSRWGDPYGPEFREAHVDLPARLATAAARSGVGRLIHVSALGAGASRETLPSMYLRSKADGEAAVRAGGVPFTILQPSVVFGPEDAFLNVFARLQRLLPVVPLAQANARLQPVFVGDVATAVVNCLRGTATLGHSFELAGPEVFTLRELVQLAGRWSGHPRPVIALPFTLGQIQAGLMGALPRPLMSTDNFDSLRVDNIATGPISPALGITPTPLAAVAPAWLSRQGSRLAAQQARAHR